MRGNDFKKTTESLKAKNQSFIERSIPYQGGEVKIIYISQLTNRQALSENVIKPLILRCSSIHEAINAKQTLETVIYADDCILSSDTGKIETYVLSGMVVILFSTDKEYIVANFKIVEHRSVPSPEISYTVRGPQDCFNECLNTNLSLFGIVYKTRVCKSSSALLASAQKTNVAVIYIDDIANPTIVNEIQHRIEAIHIDGISDSGELQALLLDHPFMLFPQMGILERSDMAYHILLEGKVLVLVDGSGIALSAPKVFSEYFYSCDDRYDNKLFGLFARIIRYSAILIALTAASLYVAVTSFHTEVLPSDYAILLATLRSNVPFSALIGASLLEFTMELLREALLRVPKQIGPAIGIVGALVVGQAAIAAGIYNPILLILSAMSLLASFAIPDYTLINPFRLLKFYMILITGFLGFFGFTVGLCTIITELVSMNSFGVPFMAPWAPYRAENVPDTLINRSHINRFRLGYLRAKDNKRSN